MIPAFNDSGCLPPGVHRATLSQIDARFGRNSEVRRAQMESVRWMMEIAIRAGVARVILNGSFVTDKDEPNDVDCVLLITPGFPADLNAAEALAAGLPFMEIKLVGQEEFDVFVNDIFGTDRMGVPKGVIEVIS